MPTLLETLILTHRAPIEPACGLDPDCANCPFPERKKFWDGVWQKFATAQQKQAAKELWTEGDELKFQVGHRGAM